MHCEHCGAAMRLDRDRGMLVCAYCGAECVPTDDDDGVQIAGPSSKPCPVCPIRLSDGLIEGFSVLYCTQCHGMLIPMDTFPLLISDLRSHRERSPEFVEPRGEADAARHLHCPQCGGEMDGHPYGGGGNVNIDSCEKCAVIWLDRRELRRIVVAPDREPLYLRYGDALGDTHPRPRK
jgi:Zn-finger nucleic acid-binding protein